jgi:hypothetical protein
VYLGISRALCHATVRNGALVVGATRRRLDFGRLLLEQSQARGQPIDPVLAGHLSRWGRGRPTSRSTATRTQWPSRLVGPIEASALTQGGRDHPSHGPVALAIRQETQLIEAYHQ